MTGHACLPRGSVGFSQGPLIFHEDLTMSPLNCPSCSRILLAPSDPLSQHLCRFSTHDDVESLATLLEIIEKPFTAYARKLCRTLPSPWHAGQGVFERATVKMVRNKKNFDCSKPFEPWFRLIVKRIAIDLCRSHTESRKPGRPGRTWSLSQLTRDEEGQGGFGYFADPAAPAIYDPAVRALSNEALQQIELEVERLPVIERLMMKEKMAGARRRDIAAEFGAEPDLVSRVLHSARGRLRIPLARIFGTSVSRSQG
jgi:RNA polymerase sigma factor (sigma-70 family)